MGNQAGFFFKPAGMGEMQLEERWGEPKKIEDLIILLLDRMEKNSPQSFRATSFII